MITKYLKYRPGTTSSKDIISKYMNIVAYKYNLNSNEILPLSKNLIQCAELNLSPYDYFNFIGNGEYKECYEAYENSPFVLKFCSNYNSTEYEKKSFEKISKSKFSNLFLPTIFIFLPKSKMNALVLNNFSYIENYFNYIQIQPRIYKTCENDTFTIEDYEKNPIKEISFHDLKIIFEIESYNWIFQLYSLYGYNFLINFSKFLKFNNIFDLHNKNIGFSHNNVPIILDWLAF